MASESKGSVADALFTGDFLARLERQRQKIVASRRPGDSEESVARRLRDGEQELLIAVRLGDDLPKPKHEALMAAYRRMQDKRDASAIELVEHTISAEEYADRLQAAIDELDQEYARVLTPEEYQRLTGEKSGKALTLPLDPRIVQAQ